MHVNRLIAAAAVLVGFALAVPDVGAQGRRGGARTNGGQAVARVPARPVSGAPPAGRAATGPGRHAPPPATGARVQRYPGPYPRGGPSYAVPRRYARPYAPSSYARHYPYNHSYYRPAWPVYAPYYYSRPYYAFRPRFSVGFGLWVGYPVTYPVYGYVGTYPYAYSYPYAYAAPYPAYGYGSVAVGSTVGAHGGVSLDVAPADALVYVDGTYVGPVNYFTPSAQPLTLAPGPHRIEIQAPGYQTIVFDVNVVAGQVIPYRGAMIPLQP